MNLDYEIIPGKGIGPFTLGISEEEIIALADGELSCNGIFKVFENEPLSKKYKSYSFGSSLKFLVDLSTNKLVKIVLHEKYEGKYQNVFGIGDDIAKLFQIRKDLTFDDIYIIVGKPEEMAIMLDVDHINSLNSVLNEVCEAIIIESVGWMYD